MKVLIETEGEDLELTIPMTAGEITYREFCDFQKEDIEFLAANQAKAREEAKVLHHLKEAVKSIAGEAAEQIPFGVAGDSIQNLVEGGYKVAMGDEVSVLRLYAHLCTVMKEANYAGKMTPQTIPFFLEITHQGKRFKVIGANAARVMNNTPLRTAEFIECMEYERLGKGSMKGKTQGEISALHYTVAISQFAILVKQRGEELPVDEGEREQWIRDRRELLADLPLTDVMKVRFFLTATLIRLGAKRNTVSSGKVRPEGKLNSLVKALTKRKPSGSSERKPD